MKKLIICLFLLSFAIAVNAQLQLTPSGANQKSVVTQYLGAHAYVSITYNSPDITSPQGASRKGQIWGQVVPYGLTNLNFGLSTVDNPSPWRAGANENTIIEFSHDVMLQGQPISAGKYGFHIIPQETGAWTIILSNNSTSWGSYYYQASEDELRVETTPEACDYEEWLTYEFIDRQETSCTASLKWDELSIPFTISLSNSKEIYVAHIQDEMRGNTGFSWTNRNTAANYCLQNDVNLEEALAWQKVTVVNSFMGSENASTLQTLAGLQLKLNDEEGGITTLMKAAKHATSNVFQIHGIGRQLLSTDEKERALELFKYNLKTSGDVWPVNVGLARGYSAMGKYVDALRHAKVALERAPNKPNKDAIEQMIVSLQKSEDIN